MQECWFIEMQDGEQWKDINGKVCGNILGYGSLREAEDDVRLNRSLYPDTKFRIVQFTRARVEQ